MQDHDLGYRSTETNLPPETLTESCRGLTPDPQYEPRRSFSADAHAIGETDVECWNKRWKSCANDPELDGEEWVTFLAGIQEYLRQKYDNYPDEFYFWGDFSGDRTLDLKIAEPTVLTARLLTDLQKYLTQNGQRMWRVRVPIYFTSDDPHRVIVIYPDSLDIAPIMPAVTARSAINVPITNLRG